MTRQVTRFVVSSVLVACGLAGAETVRLSAESVVELAQKRSVMARNAGFAVRSAQTGAKSVAAAFLPTVKGNVTYTRLDEPPVISGVGSNEGASSQVPQDPMVQAIIDALSSMMTVPELPQDIWNIGITVTQPIFLGGRLLNGYRASRLSLISEEQAERRVNDEVRLAALQIFWGYAAASQRLSVAQESRAWLEKLTGTQQAMFESGMIIEHVVLKTKVLLSQVKLEELRARHALDNLREALLLFLDMPLSTVVEIDTSSQQDTVAGDAAGPFTEKGLDEMVSGRGDIDALRTRIEALRCLRRAQAGAYLPSLMGAYNFKFANDNYEDPDKLDPGWSVSAILDVPILDWGKNYREVQKIDLQIEQLTLSLEISTLKARSEILDAHRKLTESVEEMSLSHEALVNAQRALEIAELQYNEGSITHVELHEVRKELTAAQAQVIAARTARELAAVRLQVAAGR